MKLYLPVTKVTFTGMSKFFHTVYPAVFQLALFDLVLQYRDFRVAQILVKNLVQFFAGNPKYRPQSANHTRFDGNNRGSGPVGWQAIFGRCLSPDGWCAACFHTLGIHIARALRIDPIVANNGRPIPNRSPGTPDVGRTRFFTKMILRIKPLAVIGETFVHPHVRDVAIGNVVGKPFMPRLVDNDKIPF